MLFDGDWTRQFEDKEDTSQVGPKPDALLSSRYNLRTGIALKSGKPGRGDKSELQRFVQMQQVIEMSQPGAAQLIDSSEHFTREGTKDNQKVKVRACTHPLSAWHAQFHCVAALLRPDARCIVWCVGVGVCARAHAGVCAMDTCRRSRSLTARASSWALRSPRWSVRVCSLQPFGMCAPPEQRVPHSCRQCVCVCACVRVCACVVLGRARERTRLPRRSPTPCSDNREHVTNLKEVRAAALIAAYEEAEFYRAKQEHLTKKLGATEAARALNMAGSSLGPGIPMYQAAGGSALRMPPRPVAPSASSVTSAAPGPAAVTSGVVPATAVAVTSASAPSANTAAEREAAAAEARARHVEQQKRAAKLRALNTPRFMTFDEAPVASSNSSSSAGAGGGVAESKSGEEADGDYTQRRVADTSLDFLGSTPSTTADAAIAQLRT
ncbi:hypothetical protein EON68_01085, partial [archaeon]